MDVRGDREGEAEGGVGSLGGETVKGAGVGPLRPLIRLREGEYGEGWLLFASGDATGLKWGFSLGVDMAGRNCDRPSMGGRREKIARVGEDGGWL